VNLELERLWAEVDNCSECKESGNRLQHILAGGQDEGPRIMFVFINPTHRNISSRPGYEGPRIPFLGTREIWNVFVKAGLLGNDFKRVPNGQWSQELIAKVIGAVKNEGFYFTNIVKCTEPSSKLPSRRKVRGKLPLFEREVAMVKPDLIVTFGIIPFEALTQTKIKLSEHYDKQKSSTNLLTYRNALIGGRSCDVFPCYFPVGRGDQKRALELLTFLRRLYLKKTDNALDDSFQWTCSKIDTYRGSV
jgi:uracil-DNA glycosylase family 4